MNPSGTKWITVLFISALFTACGGGGGGGKGTGDHTTGGQAPTGDTMTVSISSLSTATTTTNYSGDLSDPLMSANTSTTTNKTYVDMSSGYNLYTTSWTTTLSLTTSGTVTGTYLFSSPSATTGILYSAMPKYYQGTNGTITITSIGNVGDPVIGTFNATLGCVSNPTDTIGLSGSFNIKRIQ